MEKVIFIIKAIATSILYVLWYFDIMSEPLVGIGVELLSVGYILAPNVAGNKIIRGKNQALNGFSRNIIGDNFQRNQITGAFTNNTIGNGFKDNNIKNASNNWQKYGIIITTLLDLIYIVLTIWYNK
jgi:hypothetical protein